MKNFPYKCKQNDAILRFIIEEGVTSKSGEVIEAPYIDEVWIKCDESETGWTVIGFKDLKEAIKQAENTLK